jgi:hypothetical protein
MDRLTGPVDEDDAKKGFEGDHKHLLPQGFLHLLAHLLDTLMLVIDLFIRDLSDEMLKHQRT